MSFTWVDGFVKSLETEEGQEAYAYLSRELSSERKVLDPDSTYYTDPSWSGSSVEIQVFRGNVTFWSGTPCPRLQRQAYMDEKYRRNYRLVVADIRAFSIKGWLKPSLLLSCMKTMEAHSKMNTLFETRHRLGKKVKFVRPPPTAHWRSMFENSLNDIKRGDFGISKHFQSLNIF